MFIHSSFIVNHSSFIDACQPKGWIKILVIELL